MKRYSVMTILFMCGVFVVLAMSMGMNGERIPGHLGDNRLNNYFLEYGYKWLGGNVESFRDASFFYPEPGVMTYSETHLGTLPIYAAFRACGASREGAYQLWFIVIFALNYIVCAWALKNIGISSAGAGVGAFVFSFSLPVIAQMVHSQLLPRFAIPIAFYAAWKWFKTGKIKYTVLMCAACIWQLYCGVYTGFFTVFALALFLFVLIVKALFKSGLRGPSTGVFVKTGFVFVVAAVAIAPLLLFYLSCPLGVGGVSWEGLELYLPTPLSYLFPANGSVLWSFLESFGKYLPTTDEQHLFSGALPTLAVLLAAVSGIVGLNRKKEEGFEFASALSIALLILIVLTLNVGGRTFYHIIAALPGFSGIRAVSRIILVMLFPFAAASGALYDRLSSSIASLQRTTGKGILKTIVPAVFVVALILDQMVIPGKLQSYSKRDSRARVDRVVKSIEVAGNGVRSFYYMPLDASYSPIATNIDAMFASLETGLPTVNGYTARVPSEYYFWDYPKSEVPLKHWILEQNKKNTTINSCEESLFNGLLIIRSVNPPDFKIMWASCG